MIKIEEYSRTPLQNIIRKIRKNKFAVLGFVFIISAHVVALLGYLIMPDDTPYANDGAVQIQKKLPGFKVNVLKIKKTISIPSVNFFTKPFLGQESDYTIIPIKEYKVQGLTVEIIPYGRFDKKETFPLIHCCRQLYVGRSTLLSQDGAVFVVQGDETKYIDPDGVIQIVKNAVLLKEFNENNIESRRYWLGTDKAGRDMLSRLLYGTRISLSIGFLSVLISLALGVTLGAIGGFFGGRVDSIVMWLMTVVWSIPGIMLVIAISLVLQSKGIWVAFVAVGLTTWVDVARVIRGQILTIKEKTYVEAARALGMNNRRIIFVHILPNTMGPLIVIATANFASAILLEAGLSFLGLGVQPPMPSWGMMINEGFHTLGTKDSWHLIVFPSVAISMLVLCFNIFGNGLRDAVDPQSQIRWS